MACHSVVQMVVQTVERTATLMVGTTVERMATPMVGKKAVN